MTSKRDFSPLPQWLTTGKTVGIPSKMRKFGNGADDLAINFHRALRSALITELLANCTESADSGSVDQSILWEMPVSLRIEALLALSALVDSNPFVWRLRCSSRECSHESEFELNIGEILTLPNEFRDYQTFSVTIKGKEAILRRPTGFDQLTWLQESNPLKAEIMLRSILVRPTLEDLLQSEICIDEVIKTIDDAMDTFDPLLGFHLSVVCPQCGTSTDASPDLVGAAIERLAHTQFMVMEDVHRLASQYHWSERQIMEIPEWRRQGYLQLIENVGF